MKVVENFKNILSKINHKARAYDADFKRMTNEQRSYEKTKLHELINMRPDIKRNDVREYRDISAD